MSFLLAIAMDSLCWRESCSIYVHDIFVPEPFPCILKYNISEHELIAIQGTYEPFTNC